MSFKLLVNIMLCGEYVMGLYFPFGGYNTTTEIEIIKTIAEHNELIECSDEYTDLCASIGHEAFSEDVTKHFSPDSPEIAAICEFIRDAYSRIQFVSYDCECITDPDKLEVLNDTADAVDFIDIDKRTASLDCICIHEKLTIFNAYNRFTDTLLTDDNITVTKLDPREFSFDDIYTMESLIDGNRMIKCPCGYVQFYWC